MGASSAAGWSTSGAAVTTGPAQVGVVVRVAGAAEMSGARSAVSGGSDVSGTEAAVDRAAAMLERVVVWAQELAAAQV